MRESIFKALVLCLLPVAVAGCNKERRDESLNENTVRTMVNGRMASADKVFADVTKTAIDYSSDTTVKQYPMFWESGDRIFSYAASGVYMDYVLEPADLSKTKNNTKFEIVFRDGDPWVTAYCKGLGIGETGFREESKIKFENGVPREQTGRFSDYHICLAQYDPREDFTFSNLQAYVRFELTGRNSPGTVPGQLVGRWVNYITVEDISGAQMAGNQIYDKIEKNKWLGNLEKSGDSTDRVLKINPYGEVHFSAHKDYFVAIPLRRYSQGLRFSLWSSASDGSYECLGSVETPSFNIDGRTVIDCSDLLKYVSIYMTDMDLVYDGTVVSGSTITIVVGHTGKIEVMPIPVETTDQSVEWELVPATTTGISITQGGVLTGVTIGTGYKIRVRSIDTGLVVKEVTVDVVEKKELSSTPTGGGYTHESFSW